MLKDLELHLLKVKYDYWCDEWQHCLNEMVKSINNGDQELADIWYKHMTKCNERLTGIATKLLSEVS